MTPSPAAPGRVVIVLNPMAAAGRAGRRTDALKRAADRVLEDWELRVTEARGHATHIAAEAAEAGADLVVAVGGDGTVHEVVGGLYDGARARGDADTGLGLLPFGTGSDFQRTLGLQADLESSLRVIAQRRIRRIDLAVAETTRDGSLVEEPFINVAGFGANGEVVRRANQMDKRWGGGLTFFRASLETAVAWKPVPLRLTWRLGPDDPDETWEGTVLSGFVANGAYCGGGMWVGRGGSIHDGRFDVTVLPPDSAIVQVIRSRRLYDGSLVNWPGARRFQASALTVEPAGHRTATIDLDGEAGGSLPARFRVLPGALRVCGQWSNDAG